MDRHKMQLSLSAHTGWSWRWRWRWRWQNVNQINALMLLHPQADCLAGQRKRIACCTNQPFQLPIAHTSAAAEFEEDSSSSSWKRVCVMDAGGSLGSSIVHRLLQTDGYLVHATVQDHVGMQRLQRIIGNSNKRLTIFNSDPLDYHSIVEALEGCCGLFYCFEPPSDQPSYDEFMPELEVRAAHNVLEACARTDTIDKVVFTSSATAIIWTDPDGSSSPSSEVNETSWSNINICKKFKLWHGLSKTLAERTAWALAMDREVNMVSVNGGLVMSNDLTITHPYLKGAAEMYEDSVFVTVDLQFLVDAHICVLEDVSAYGRYLCFNHVINRNEDAVELAHLLLPESAYSLPHSLMVGDTKMRPQRISNKKLNKLMVESKSGFLR